MMISTLKKISLWIGKFLYLQLFVSLIALPILLCWGLPLSLLSPIGNLIFGPALTLFLFLASLLFFTELLHIPNSIIAQSLDVFTQKWLGIMKIQTHQWLFGFAKPSIPVLIFIPLCALLVIHYKKFKNIWQRIACLSLLLVGSSLYIRTIHTKTNTLESLACNNGHVTIINDKNKVLLIDPGVIGQRINAASWVEFTLVPHLISSSGVNTIDDLILLQPGAMLFQAVTTLITKIKVKKIYLVCWQGSLAKHEWRSFFAMREAAQKQGVSIERITYKKIEIPLAHSMLTIEPLKSRITSKEITYPVIKVRGTINQKTLEIMSAKSKK